jgi:hypothetical protein
MPAPSPPIVSNRSGRQIRMPARFKDFLPGSTTHLPQQIARNAARSPSRRPSTPPEPLHSPLRSPSPVEPEPFITEPDRFGLYHVYPSKPTHTITDTLDSVCDYQSLDPTSSDHVGESEREELFGRPCSVEISADELFAPFSNPSAAILTAWHFSGSDKKSGAETERLASLQTHPAYNPADFRVKPFSLSRETKRLDEFLQKKQGPFRTDYGWHNSSIKIHLPKEGKRYASESDAPQMTIDGVWHHDLVDVITNAFESDTSLSFNMTPFSQRWKVNEKDIDVFSEAYSSPEMLQAHKEVNALPREPGDTMEHVVASLMIWSDSTQLTNFGNASMWPFYLYFGNQSKYARGKPTAAACHHLAYIPKVHF